MKAATAPQGELVKISLEASLEQALRDLHLRHGDPNSCCYFA